ncbi:hypothetical protein QR78_00375 [Methylobacterium indicum]|uniref:Uncharacterized protein n=1 Tax=Methylobacterium indicum TaxID=1775910 RepID=A0ABR5GYQ4_9HYPH|nr:hypothetical protein QR79_24185 [Methylobacterium indicum]KMO24508.1 hypothetical protein QR78_00375 [Methylobacterium indicum]
MLPAEARLEQIRPLARVQAPHPPPGPVAAVERVEEPGIEMRLGAGPLAMGQGEAVARIDLDEDPPVDLPEGLGETRQAGEPGPAQVRPVQRREGERGPGPAAPGEVAPGPERTVRGEERKGVAAARVAEEVVIGQGALGEVARAPGEELRLVPRGGVVPCEPVSRLDTRRLRARHRRLLFRL